LRVAIALVFAAPAALAGYSATSMLFGLASMSEDRREAFSILGAIAIGAIAWQRLAATPPSANDSDQRRPAQAWGQAHSTAHWIRAADLSGGRCKFERHRLMRIKIERYGRPSLERFARRANPHSPSRPTVRMRSASCGTRGERPNLTHKVTLRRRQLAHGVSFDIRQFSSATPCPEKRIHSRLRWPDLSRTPAAPSIA
jgi:hypothetical protein